MKKALKILLGLMLAVTIALLVYAVATTQVTEKDLAAINIASTVENSVAISLNIVWTYILMVAAVVAALACAVVSMVKNPSTIKGTLLSVGLIAVIVLVAFFVTKGQVPEQIAAHAFPDAEGGYYDNPTVLTISGTSIYVAYIAMAGAFLAAIYSEVANLFK